MTEELRLGADLDCTVTSSTQETIYDYIHSAIYDALTSYGSDATPPYNRISYAPIGKWSFSFNNGCVMTAEKIEPKEDYESCVSDIDKFLDDLS